MHLAFRRPRRRAYNRRVRLVAILVVAACSGDDSPPYDPSPPTWPGGVTWSWSFSDGGGCPDEVVKVNLYRAGYDEVPFVIRLEPTIQASAPCTAFAGGFPLANPLGVRSHGHDTWIEFVTADGRVFAKSPVYNTKTKVSAYSFDVSVPRGWAHVAWTLVGAATQTPLTCEDVPALRTTPQGDGAVLFYESNETDIVLSPTDTPCTAADAWLSLPAGTYDLSLAAFSSLEFLWNDPDNSKKLGKTTFAAQTIVPGQTLELGTATIPLTDY